MAASLCLSSKLRGLTLLSLLLIPALGSVSSPARADEIAADPIAAYRDQPLRKYFPEAAVQTSDDKTKGDASTQDALDNLVHPNVTDEHIRAFDKVFQAYLKAQISKGNQSPETLTWWKNNGLILMQKKFLNTDRSIGSLAELVGALSRQKLPDDPKAKAGGVWYYVSKYGGWTVPVALALLDAVKNAYIYGPLGSMATASLQNWIRGPNEEIATYSSQLKEGLGKALSNMKRKKWYPKVLRKKHEVQLNQAEQLLDAAKKRVDTLQEFINKYNFANLTEEQAEALMDNMRDQANSAFNSQNSTIPPYLREGRANILDAQFRPMNFAQAVQGFRNGGVLSEESMARQVKYLEDAGIDVKLIDKLLSANQKLYEAEHKPSIDAEEVSTLQTALKETQETLDSAIAKTGKRFHFTSSENLMSKQNELLRSWRQMAGVMAAWWDHDVRFPELNRKNGEIAQIARTMKDVFGFGEYLHLPGIQEEMKKILADMNVQITGMQSKITEKRAELGLPVQPKAASDCVTNELENATKETGRRGFLRNPLRFLRSGK